MLSVSGTYGVVSLKHYARAGLKCGCFLSNEYDPGFEVVYVVRQMDSAEWICFEVWIFWGKIFNHEY